MAALHWGWGSLDDLAAREIEREAIEELRRRYPGSDQGPVPAQWFVPPQGAFVLGHEVFLPGFVVACGGWSWHPSLPGMAELHRVYVRPEYRRRNYGRTVIRELELSARRAGAVWMGLRAGHGQPEALALYQCLGYTEIPRWKPTGVFLGKELTGVLDPEPAYSFF
jgi:GNAT superfamily N-acetyltransferase